MMRGVAQVLAFNWPKVLAGAVAAAAPLPKPARAGAAWFTVASLAASWWVYDLSGSRAGSVADTSSNPAVTSTCRRTRAGSTGRSHVQR